MPPSAKRGPRGQRDLRKPDQVDATNDRDSIESSPSPPLKRRKRTRSPGLAEGGASNPARAESSARTDDDQLVAQVTQQLKSQAVQASRDHANAIHEANGDGVKAYAKVAAQDWTYYITKLTVNIGRAPEGSSSSHGGGGVAPDSRDTIHIDLGPSKMVSRDHASISFDSKDEKWMLNVKGRNGVKVNGQPLKAGICHSLTSGEVLEIGNVEMIFVLPSEITPLHIHPTFLRRCGLSTETPPDAGDRRLTSTKMASAPLDQQNQPPGTPSADRHALPTSLRSPLPASTPAVTMGSSTVDLSQDDNQHIKPQYSYAQMITQAILNAPDGKLNLNGIYNFIMNSYSYYRHQQAAGWQNSIRHNLSLNKSFDKVARSTDEPGKGMKWQIIKEAKEEMARNAFKIGRGGHRGSSVPSSPSQLNYITHGPRDMAVRDPPSARKRRRSPPASPPPRSSMHAAQLTPDHSVHRQNRLTADGSPLPRPRKSIIASASAAAADSSFSGFQPQSPTLTSSYLQDDGASFVTPAPPRVHPRLAPPSTAQRPSQHMPTSSPAPFWKYADIGSTPLKPLAPYDSPSKVARGGRLPSIQSSSPASAGKSPPSSPSRPQRSSQPERGEPVDPDDEGEGEGQEEREDREEEEEEGEREDEEGFDLMKGFQSIGAYHAPVGRGVSVPTALKSK